MDLGMVENFFSNFRLQYWGCNQLSWGCPVFHKDELLLFGVHATWDSHHWDDVRNFRVQLNMKFVLKGAEIGP